MDRTRARNVSVLTFVFALIALIIGALIGYALKASMPNQVTTLNNSSLKTAAVSSKGSDLRANLVVLGTAHMDLTAQAVDSALDGNANADAAKQALIGNGTALSEAVGSVYGADAQKKFQDIWNIHLVDFVNYAVADSKGDSAGAQAALTDIHDNYTVPISQLLSGANPNLPEATLETQFGEHIDMTAQMIDYHVKGDYTSEQKTRDMAVTHIEGLMSTLAGAIVKQYPDKF